MISIVVPIYNAEKYLADCLDSLVAQSDHDIEILCVDDGSTDQTIDILNSYSERYPFLRVVNQHNQGPSAARNRGIDEAKGEWIMFVDSDDWIDRNAFSRLQPYFNSPYQLIAFSYIREFRSQSLAKQVLGEETETFDDKDEVYSLFVRLLAPIENGKIHPDDVAGQTDGTTALVSVMYVNNETGAIMPVGEIFARARLKNPQIICHTDAVQAFGKLEIKAKKLGADIISVSGHKVFAPKGVGAIYIKRGVRLVPRQYGGEQEKKLRPGTEPLPLIAAFGTACGEFAIKENYEAAARLNSYAREKLAQLGGVLINSPDDALPYVLNITAGRVRSETMLHFLEERQVYVSSGSACAKGKPSHVLSAMGFGRQRADSALRISFSKHNAKEDIDVLCGGIELGLKTLAHR